MEIWETVEIWCVSQSSKNATKLESFAFSSRASRLRGESPAQDSPRSREEREDFAKKNPFLPAKDFRVSSTVSGPRHLRARQEIRCAFWRERRAGRCEAPRRRRCRGASSRSGNKADTRPSPPRPSGLRPASPLALSLAPHIPHRVLLVARASPAGLGASSKVYR